MADNQIILKRSAVPAKVPTTASLALGELAINTFDGKMFFKKNDGTESIVEIGRFVITGGDVSATGSGDYTVTINNDAVTFAKIQNIPTNTMLGRVSATTGDVEALTPGQIRSLLNVSEITGSEGTVKSVGLALPNIFTVSGSPVTATGTLTATLNSQNANLVFAGPHTSSGVPSFRALVASDIPDLSWSKVASGKPTTLSGYGISDAVVANGGIVAGTATKITFDSKGLVTGGSSLIESDIPDLDWGKITGKPSSLAGYNITDAVAANVAITGGTFAKITFDAKGLVTAGANLIAADIPDLAWAKITSGKPTTLSGYGITDGVLANTAIVGGTATKITYDAKGLVTAGTNPTTLAGYGITDAVVKNNNITAGTATKITYDAKGLVTAGTSPTTLSGYGITDAVLANTAIVGATATKITFDAKGLVTAGTSLADTDIPNISWAKITSGKPTTLAGYGITNAVVSNAAITGATATKITFDAKGLVTAGGSLVASDIPDLDWSQITSGTPTTLAGYGINDGLIANASIVDGIFTKVIVDTKGLVTLGDTLDADDIPDLSWAKITSGKPTTLAGYGITDAATSTHNHDTVYVALTGDQTIAGNKTFSNNVTISGNLTIGGGTTTIDATNLAVSDAIIQLARGNTTSASSYIGIQAERGTTDAWFLFNEGSDRWAAYTGADTTGLTLGNIEAATFYGALSGNAATATKLAAMVNINGVAFDGSANITVTAASPNTLTRGTYLTGSDYNGGAATTWAVDAASTNTVSKIVARDSSGNFSAGTITAALSGNATTATTLQNARTFAISGGATGTATSFNGSANITIPVTALDATKLGGVMPDASLPTRLGITSLIVTDWNNAISNGWYQADSALNAPTGTGWYIGFTENHGNAGYCTQTVHAFTSDADADTKAYRRSLTNGTWSAWYRLRLSETEQSAIYNNASNLDAGTVPDARLSGTYTNVSIGGNAATATKWATGRTISLTGNITGTSGNFDGSGNLSFATTIANDAVSNAMLANMAVNTIKGRVTAGTGDPEDLTAAQVRTLLNIADGATANTGTVTSVALSLPNIFSVSGSPVTTNGTLTAALANQTANTVFAGPTTGVAAAPGFRALVAADIPDISWTKITSNKPTTLAGYGITDAVGSSTAVLLTGDQTIAGNKTFDNNVTINGNLVVAGTTTTIDATNLSVADAIIQLARGNSAAAATHIGFQAERGATDAWFLFNESNDRWGAYTGADTTALTLSDIEAATFYGALSGNASTATTWATGRTIALTGNVTGTSTAFDGSGNLSFATTIANDSVTNARLANMAVSTIKGRVTAGTGDPEDLTAAQVRTLLNIADGANNYVHPTGDGNLHVPATSTTNNTKVLKAGATAGAISWDFVNWAEIGTKPTTLAGFGITDAVVSNTAITPGSYAKVTVDAKGLVTAGTTLVAADIPNISWAKITSGTPTTLAGYGITDAVASNVAITAGTHPKITFDAKGLVTGGAALVATDIPSLDWAKITTGKPTTLAGYGITNAVVSNSAITGATATKITFDAKGLVTAGAALIATDIPDLSWAKITSGKPTTLAGYGITDAIAKNIAITPGTFAKITFDANGLVTAGANLIAADIPDLSWAKITSGKPTTLAGYGITDSLVGANVAITPGTFAKITFDAKGLVTAGEDLVENDIPDISWAKILTTPTTLAGYGITNAVVANAAITGATATKITFDAKGLVTAGTSLAATDIPSLDWAKISTGKPTTLSGYGITDAVVKNTNITAGTATKITYDAKGLVTAGAALIDTDIPNISWAKITSGKPTTLSGYGITDGVVANAAIVGGSAAKITYDAKGLVTAGAALVAADIPNISWAKITSGTPTTLAGYGITDAVAANIAITPGTFAKITFDAKGLVTGGAALAASDVPDHDWAKITTGKPTTLAGYGITNGVVSNAAITGATATKITYDAKGLVTAGTSLAATDIPSLDWAKITTGKPTTLAGYGITDAIGTGTAVLLTGDQTIAGNKTFSNNVTISGDLIVSGATTTIDATNLTVSDAVIQLARGNSAASATHIGLQAERGTTDAWILFNESNDRWGVYTGADTTALTVTNFEAATFYGALSGNATTATTLQNARNINGVSFNGSADITVADATKLPLAGGTLTGALTLSGDPTADLHAVPRRWVQSRMAKDSCRVGTTANLSATATTSTLTNNGTLAALVIDGITLAVNDRVLVKNQTTTAQNGIYTVTNAGSASVAWVLTRAGGMDTWTDIPGAFTAVEQGTSNGDTLYLCTSDPGGTLGTTAITWQLVSNAQVAALGAISSNGIINRTGANTFTALSVASANTASAVVQRDGSGNFTAGTITAALTGNASTATTWATGRTITLTGDITGTSTAFNGSADLSFATAISANSVLNADLADMAVNTIKGRATAGTGDPEDLTAAQVRTILNVADGANNYVHPTGDGNLHVPATSTTNSTKVLKAGATAGNFGWDFVNWAEIGTKPTTLAGFGITDAAASTHNHDAQYLGITAKAADADLLDGYNAATSATAATIALRDSSGDIFARYFDGQHIAISHASSSRTTDTVFYSSTDNYVRKNNATSFRTSLAVYSKTEADGRYTPFATISAATAAAAGWYRVATSATNIGANSGQFKLEFVEGTTIGRATIIASCMNGVAAATQIQQLGYSSTNTAAGITQARIVYHTTATANFAYLEVYCPTASATTITVDVINSTGWTLVTPSTAGSIPAGYSNKSMTFDEGIYSLENVKTDKQLVSTIATGTAPLVITSTTAVTNLNSDLLDGQHGSYYLSAANLTGTIADARLSGTYASASIGGNAATATALQNARTINGVSFNGTANITVADATKLPLAGGTLTGAVTSSLGALGGTATNELVYNTLSGTTTNADNLITRLLRTTTGTAWNQASWEIRRRVDVTDLGFMRFSSNSGVEFGTGTTVRLAVPSSGSVTIDGSAIWTAANLTNLNQLTNGPGYITGSGSITGNAATATTLQNARTINGVSFNGSANITIADDTKLPLAGGTLTGQLIFSLDHQDFFIVRNNATTTNVNPFTWRVENRNWRLWMYGADATGRTAIEANVNTGVVNLMTGSTVGSSAIWTAATLTNLNQLTNGPGYITGSGSITGNAATATTLQNARTINGVSFNGSANITINAVDSTARLALTGGTLTGALTLSGDPTSDLHAATKRWVESRMAKDSCRVASTGNISVAAPGATIDGITLAASDRVLLKNQTAGAENGIYIWNGAAVAMTRAGGMDTWTDVPGAFTAVEEGTTNANTLWFCTNVKTGTLGTTAITWQLVSNPLIGAIAGTASNGVIARTGATTAGIIGYAASNLASTLVQRDGSGNFTAGTITAALTGNASTATTLQTARNINGVSFNGSADITINAVDSTARLALTGGTMTGSIAMNTSGLGLTFGNLGGGNGIFSGNADAATNTQANVQIKSWYGIGFGPSITGQTVPQNENAVWMDVRSGNMSARGTITAPTFSGALSGNATTATTLQNARTINGVSFNGSANITINAVDSTARLALTGGTLTGGLAIAANYPYLTFNDNDGTAGQKTARMDYEAGRFAFQLLQDGTTTWVRDILKLWHNGTVDVYGPLNLETGNFNIATGGKVYIGGVELIGNSPWTVKTGTYTAVSGDRILANTTAAGFTINLPASPATGAEVIIADDSDFSVNNLIIGRNTKTINGVADNLDLDIKGVKVHLVYDGTTWETFFDSVATGTNGGLATVATTGSYNDLLNKPTIPTLPPLATVATTGSYADLIDKPTIPTTATEVDAVAATDGVATNIELRASRVRAETAFSGSGAVTLNYANGDYRKVTATGAITITLSNMPGTGQVGSYMVEATNWGAYTITHPTGTKFAGGVAPTFTTSGIDIVTYVVDGTNVIRCLLAAKDVK